MQLGIRSQDLITNESLTAEGLVNRLNSVELDNLQLVCHKTFHDIRQIPGGLDDRKAQLIADTLAYGGKYITLIASYFNPIHSNIEKRLGCIQVFKEYLDYTHMFGTCVVASETGSYNDDNWTYHAYNRTPEALKKVIETFAELSRYADKVGARVGIEGAAGHVCYDVNTLKSAVDNIGKNVTIIFDLYNFLEKENSAQPLKILEQGLKVFQGNIHCFHLKDFVCTPSGIKQVPIGQGELDYRAMLRMIKHYDPSAKLILEGTRGEDISYAVNYVRQTWDEC